MIYNEAITAAMLAQMQDAQPDRIILTGDLVNQGDEQDHQKMAAMLRKVNETVPVRVIPGNHDLAMVTREEFANLYHEFGYDQAYSRDPDSLSYAELTDAGVLLVLLDTNSEKAGRQRGDIVGLNLEMAAGPGRTSAAVRLADADLQPSQSARSHRDGFQRYRCRGRHGQSLAGTTERENAYQRAPSYRAYPDGRGRSASLTEIVLPMPIAWPNTYGSVQISAEGLDYTQETIDVAAWAQTQGLANRICLIFLPIPSRHSGRSIKARWIPR